MSVIHIISEKMFPDIIDQITGGVFIRHAPVKSTTPVRGCHLAHKGIVEFAMRFDFPYVIIMEEDVKFTSKNAFQYFISNMPERFDIYTAGVYGMKTGYNPDTGEVQRISGTHCYVVHKWFYKRFLSMNEHEHIDQELTRMGKEGYAILKMCYPMAALQKPGYSLISQQQVDYNTDKWITHPLFETTLKEFRHECENENLSHGSMAKPD